MTHDITRTAAYYDEIADAYDGRGYSQTGPDYPANLYRLELAKSIIATLPPGRVLDAGCGTGRFLAHLAREGHDCAGCDFSAGMLARARANLAEVSSRPVRLVQAALHDLSMFEDESFDYVFALGVFPYIPEELESGSYRELRRVIRPGGIFVSAHENELFDLFTFNKYTLRFFDSNIFPLLAKRRDGLDLEDLRAKLASLIVHPDLPVNTDPERSGRDIIFTRPENPLVYGSKLTDYGFAQQDLLYYHFHALPPLLRNGDRELEELSKQVELTEARAWQGMFLASTFLSVAQATQPLA